jgi:Tfp pilus assembly protein PilF
VVAAPAIAASSAAVSPSASVKIAPRVDAASERRFWLESARAAQRRYRVDEAERLYRRVLVRSPGDCEALAGLGELELLRGDAARATERFNDALRANADYIPAQLAVADLEWQSGRADAARARYREIVDKYSSDLYPPYVAQRSESDPPECEK